MIEPIPGNVYKNKDIPNANTLYSEMKLFPTPFKGIYYVPYESERNGQYITDPHLIIFKAAELYLKSNKYYFGLYSALYYHRIIWNALGLDILNMKISRKINRKLPSKKYWRGRVINKILSVYPFPIRFHRIGKFDLLGVIKKGAITYSDLRKTKSDAIFLCKKGDKTACEVLKILEKTQKNKK